MRFAREAPFAGGFGVAVKLARFAVNRDQELGPHGVEHDLEITLAAMPGDMNARRAAVNDMRAAFEEVIHHPRNRAFVARNLSRRKHDGVAFEHAGIAVIIYGPCAARPPSVRPGCL